MPEAATTTPWDFEGGCGGDPAAVTSLGWYLNRPSRLYPPSDSGQLRSQGRERSMSHHLCPDPFTPPCCHSRTVSGDAQPGWPEAPGCRRCCEESWMWTRSIPVRYSLSSGGARGVSKHLLVGAPLTFLVSRPRCRGNTGARSCPRSLTAYAPSHRPEGQRRWIWGAFHSALLAGGHFLYSFCKI